ncbi:MAG TPA: SBBP repeat-containing protein [Terriglobia bacterium]|nr:SBBP repeat-containing protein [Terriglobia bacterium]
MRLVGANAGAAVAGADELPGKSNYFIGNDSKKWRRNVPNYAKVKYQNVYPGVDLVYYGNQSGQLEYDFVVAPGADLSVIALDVAAGLSRQPDGTAVPESPTVAAGLPRHRSSEDGGVKPPLQERAHRDAPLQIATNGDLVVEADGCEVRFHKPLVYQPAINNGQRTTDHGQPTPVEGDFVLQASNRVGFEVASYDHTRPLVIDPVLSYSTYLGGSSGYYPATHGYAIAVDSAGNAYVTGYTQSDNFPTVNPFQANYHGYGATGDAFVAKLNAAGSALVYSTYLGGNNLDVGYGIAVDSSGNAYVTGETGSTDFPTLNPIQAINHGLYGNAFVAKLNASGSALVYATYLGGSYSDIAYSIAVDSSENAYVTGQAASPDFPTANPLRATKSGYSDAFVAKLNAAGSALVYSTYLGGSSFDIGHGIAVDSSGNAYVTGETGSSNFPTVNPLQATNKSTVGSNAFVAKLNAAGSALVYSTYLGGSYEDNGYGIAVDSSGNAYVTGYNASHDFPTVNAIQATCAICSGSHADAFVAKLNAAGSALVYSTYLGGSIYDIGYGIAVDSSGEAYVTGLTGSTDFPTVDPVQATLVGGGNAYVAEFSAAGSALVYSTYLGGGSDNGYAIAVDPSGNAYVTGFTASADFPTVNPLQATSTGNGDAFVARIAQGTERPSVRVSPSSLTFAPQNLGTTRAAQVVTLSNTSGTALTISNTVAAGDFAQSNNCAGSLGAGAGCTISVTFTPTSIGTRTGAITIMDNAADSPQTVTLSGLGLRPVVCLPGSLSFPSTVEFTTSHSQTVTCTNTQSASVTFSSITTNLTDFGVTNSGTCSTLSPLLPGGHCTIVVSFSPSIVGLEEGTLTITDSANSQSVSLSGRGNP